MEVREEKREEYEEIFHRLMERGEKEQPPLDINHQTHQGETPLHFAVAKGCLLSLSLLLSYHPLLHLLTLFVPFFIYSPLGLELILLSI